MGLDFSLNEHGSRLRRVLIGPWRRLEDGEDSRWWYLSSSWPYRDVADEKLLGGYQRWFTGNGE